MKQREKRITTYINGTLVMRFLLFVTTRVILYRYEPCVDGNPAQGEFLRVGVGSFLSMDSTI